MLDVEVNLRCALSHTTPGMADLVSKCKLVIDVQYLLNHPCDKYVLPIFITT